ncbi:MULTISPECIES: DUF2877 domain-containing protein [Rahnella]|jgi:hypothetical protein|uniref:DUF2877 domain-containing protein n=1 Tax=Rahnella sp. (strain Y9602) TaxID=2703885 RepID=A0ABW6CEY2_RAHSY|nr:MULTISPECIES: DUF2877 domain-containing protein [Rahnella]MBU9868597.1 DUF2877 domain-containing protein [Rahnella aceris]MCM2445566.1 DUF2877 domain-containing protein [Rahnella sp. CG8]
MNIPAPLAVSAHAPVCPGDWQVVGLFSRAINLSNERGEWLTLHRYGKGLSPMGWLLRARDFEGLLSRLTLGDVMRAGAENPPARRLDLHVTQGSRQLYDYVHGFLTGCPQLTGLFGELRQVVLEPPGGELAHIQHQLLRQLQGHRVDWQNVVGKGAGLTPSHDDTLTGMLLVCAAHGLPVGDFFDHTPDLRTLTSSVSCAYLHHAVRRQFSTPLLHLIRARRAEQVLALGHTSGADTLLGVWLALTLFREHFL